MKRTLALIALVIVFGFTSVTERQFNFKFSEKEATQIIQSIQNSELISAKDASLLIDKIQKQAVDTVLNPKK